jgi:hypothetical protein
MAKEKMDKKVLENDILKLQKGIEGLINLELFPKIIIDIHGPGWTTPAEYLLFHSLVKFSISQVNQLKDTLASVEMGNKAITAG